MSASDQDKQLLELLERWQTGDFSRADEQALRALAASDEFRRDVVEGFLSLPEEEHSQRLANLQSRLRRRINGSRKFALPQWWLAAAAALALVLAVVWLLPTPKNTQEMVQQETAPVIDTQPIAGAMPEEKTSNRQEISLDRASQTISSNASDSRSLDKSALPQTTIPPTPELAAAPPSRTQSIESESERANKPATTYGVAKDDQDIDPSAGNMAFPAKAKQEEDAKPADALKKRAKTAPTATAPAGGLEKVQDYLRRTARLPEAAKQHNVSGSVRLQFRLDSNNQPVDFKVVRSLGYGCDEEAIRLIKAYPWQYIDDDTVTLDVPFVR